MNKTDNIQLLAYDYLYALCTTEYTVIATREPDSDGEALYTS